MDRATLPPILWLGLLSGASGYADEARGFLRVLDATGEPLVARELGQGSEKGLGEEDRALLRRLLGRSPEGVRAAVHHYAPAWARQTPSLDGLPNVARTMFETDRLPAAWLPQLLARDEVWVPCQHNRESFERGGIPSSRLRVVGGTLDFDTFRPGIEPLELDVPAGHLVFLSNFEFSERKAWRQLLLAWARSFAPTDPVCLVLKTTTDPGGELAARVQDELAVAARAVGRPGTAPVSLLARMLDPAGLAAMYARADAYVLASRGEGWGRPYMEALAMGLPTVASRWSGPVEFMRDETSWLVDGTLATVPEDHGVFADAVSGHRWFEPDLESLTAALCDIAADPAAARRRAAPARAQLIAEFGPAATAERLRAALREVVERGDRRARDRRVACLRGPFGRNSSLAIINDQVLAGLEAGGRRMTALGRGATGGGAPCVSISHSWPPDFSAATAGPAALILPWEYGHPPVEWVELICREIDRVIVPSRYVRDGYIAGGIPAGIVEVVPNGVDTAAFSPEGPARDLGRSAGCVFLFVGGTIWRKGIDILLQAWERAFDADDDVLLVVKDFGTETHYRGQTAAALIAELSARNDAAPILHLTEEVPAPELPALYRAADVLVAPYRGEGFGMPILEAMACGLPAIHPSVGPSSEFVGEGGWSVPAEPMPLSGKVGERQLAGEGYVHEVEFAPLVEALRHAARQPRDRRRRASLARAQAERYDWREIALQYEAVIARLEQEERLLARQIAPAQVEGQAHLALYRPSWEDEHQWGQALVHWASLFPEEAEVTLVLPVAAGEAEARMEQLVARLEQLGLDPEAVPDIALVPYERDGLAALVAAAELVVLDPGQAAGPQPAAIERAVRVVELFSAELDAWARTVAPARAATAA